MYNIYEEKIKGSERMRTNNSIKNIISVLFFNVIIGLLGFVKARCFVDGLDNDIYSLNQLFYQIFVYIQIADLGLCLIVNKQLYKALSKDDKDEVNNIYSAAKVFFKSIGIIMLVISLILSFFIKYLTKANVSPLYMQIVFIIFIFRNVVDYFFFTPRCVLEADQKMYKVNHLLKSIKIIETIVEIVLVLLGVNYIIVLLPGIAITIIIDILMNKKVFKEYPWLEDKHKYNKKYLTGIKHVIWQKLSVLLSANTDIILISTFINPLNVIIYTSYNYVCQYLSDTLFIISSSITPSFANLLHKEKEEKKYSVFTELNILFLFIASFVMIMLYGFLTPLISFWMGNEYITTNLILLLFCLITFQKIADRPMAIIINSHGLFKETQSACIIEALLNLSLSLILVKPLGILGVLVGTVLSKLLITTIQYPIYIMKNIFKQSSFRYLLNYFIVIGINMFFIFIINQMIPQLPSITTWIIYVIIFAIIVGISLFVIYFISFKSFKLLTNRGKDYLKNCMNNYLKK